MLPGAFADKITPDIDFTVETVNQCDAPWYLRGPYVLTVSGPSFLYTFSFLRS